MPDSRSLQGLPVELQEAIIGYVVSKPNPIEAISFEKEVEELCLPYEDSKTLHAIAKKEAIGLNTVLFSQVFRTSRVSHMGEDIKHVEYHGELRVYGCGYPPKRRLAYAGPFVEIPKVYAQLESIQVIVSDVGAGVERSWMRDSNNNLFAAQDAPQLVAQQKVEEMKRFVKLVDGTHFPQWKNTPVRKTITLVQHTNAYRHLKAQNPLLEDDGSEESAGRIDYALHKFLGWPRVTVNLTKESIPAEFKQVARIAEVEQSGSSVTY